MSGIELSPQYLQLAQAGFYLRAAREQPLKPPTGVGAPNDPEMSHEELETFLRIDLADILKNSTKLNTLIF